MTEFAAEPIAIIGMSARVPGAASIEEFWRNLVAGHDSLTVTTLEEQLALGANREMVEHPAFVPAAQIISDMEYFDAGLFGMNPREAEIADPQLRVFLEQAHATLLNAGYDATRFDGDIGVYTGTGPSVYQWLNIRTHAAQSLGAIGVGVAVSNNIDYIATTVSYRLDLRGPSMTVSTACSSSLVAVHLACEALRSAECDMALAGGVCLEFPWGLGYPSMDGFTSSDGHVRPFDAKADGTIWGSGTGVIMLKRLSDAQADGDHVRGLILGNAINNDGAGKAGFSAPSVEGQAAVIQEALGVANVDPRTVGYVEAHGTGTALGDPIEVAALTSVYGRDAQDTGWCGIGSVKSNIGHLSQASGVIGLIKAVLTLEHGMIPPSINFDEPNPAIDFDAGPFYVVTAPTKWLAGGEPRRAAVSSFGIGGTNAHVVLQEAPAPEPRPAPAGRPRLLRLSARTAGALSTARDQLAAHLEKTADLVLDDVAHTLDVGRSVYKHRAAVVAADLTDAVSALRERRRFLTGTAGDPAPGVALLFSGQGAQYAGMGAELYETEPVFAAAIDECAELAAAELGEDLRAAMFGRGPESDALLRETRRTQPALFMIGYGLAKLWRHWGVEPAAMIGHSIGEYVAATLAGVFTLPDAVRLVCARGRLMQSMPAGSMLAVQRDEEWVAARLPEGVGIATVNGPGVCVVAGPAAAVDAFAARLKDEEDVKTTALRTSHAFHSPMMDPILAEFTEVVAAVPRQAPLLPFLSNVTGDWITPEEAVDPAYWARHLRRPVRFADCVATLLAEGRWVLLECGPGKQLAGLARMQTPKDGLAPLASLPAATERAGAAETLLTSAGRLWTAGVAVDIPVPGRRAPLPGYPYEREYHFLSPSAPEAVAAPVLPSGPRGLDDWFEVPAWNEVPTVAAGEPFARCLAFAGDARGEELVAALRAGGTEVVTVRPGSGFARLADGYTLVPGDRAGYDALVEALVNDGGVPARIVHAWPLTGHPAGTDPEATAAAQENGLYSLLWLTQALAAAQVAAGVRIDVVTDGTQDVLGHDLTRPEHATVAGIAQVAPVEIDGLTVGHLDLDPAGTPVKALLAELRRPAEQGTLALRNGRRWQRGFRPAPLPADVPGDVLKPGGRYLITGGTGGIGITMAEELGTRLRARIVLLSRSGLPEGDPRTARASAAIRRVEAAGGSVKVVAADVTDPVRLRRIREEAVAELGGLDGIVHAAGLPGGGMVELKERGEAQAVLAPKIYGTLALWNAFGDLDLDFVALCSSVTGIAGGFGQVDYTAGNAFEDAFARSRQGGPRVLSLNWGVWLEVGMAADTDAPAAVGRNAGVTAAVPVEHGILRSRIGHEVRGPISAETHAMLDEHRMGEVPIMPGTGQLECVRAAFEAVVPSPGPGHVIELRDLAFVKPLAVRPGTTGEVVVEVVTTADGGELELRTHEGMHARGSAVWAEARPPARVDLDALLGGLRKATAEEIVGVHDSVLNFGPSWHHPEHVWFGEREQIGLVEAIDAVAADLDRWGLHPVLLDIATSFGTGDGRQTGLSYMPLAYGTVRVHDRLPDRFYSHLRMGDFRRDSRMVALNFTLIDESGKVLVEIEDFEVRQVEPGTVSALGDVPESAPTGWSYAGASGEPSDGIRPVDGVEAFRRALAADAGAQIVISSMAIAEIIEGERRFSADEPAPEQAAEAVRVVRDGDFLAPEGELQTTLAGIWSGVLGVKDIAADDDFIDLGGNSLVAVQLIAQVRTTVGVRLPMRALFEAPTIAQMAAKIESLRAAQDGAAPAAAPSASAPIPRVARRMS
ncbi:SDR family NAD(P)-dependent oxidoreductase [Nonomuraea sp. NPDC050540]|uniref:type I polyketide synthase n=1 Tax=Nonomuraea sp. NPDC050540 TaxID=3364367 RepID=UPI003794E186